MRAIGTLAGAFLLMIVSMAPAMSQPAAGTASGHVVLEGGERVEIRHVQAMRVDDAVRGEPNERRLSVLLSDRPVAPEIFENRATTSIDALARRGEVRGLLIRFDPNDREGFSYTELMPSPSPQTSLRFGSISSSEGVWQRLDLAGGRVSGAFDGRAGRAADEAPQLDAAFAFDAAIVEDPLHRILTGSEAAASELVPLGIAHLEAGLGRMSAQERETFEPMVRNLLSAVRTPLRVVLRERTAILVVGDGESWVELEFVRENSGWRALQRE